MLLKWTEYKHNCNQTFIICRKKRRVKKEDSGHIHHLGRHIRSAMNDDYEDGTYEVVSSQNRLKYKFPQNMINKWPRYGRKEEMDIVTKIENPYYS